MFQYELDTIPSVPKFTLSNNKGQSVGTGWIDVNGVQEYHSFITEPDGSKTIIQAPNSAIVQLAVVSFPGSAPPPGTSGNGTAIYAINNDGAVTGHYTDANGTIHGYVRDPSGQYTTVDVAHSSATWVQGIDGAGNIMGSYIDRTDNMQKLFQATPVGFL